MVASDRPHLYQLFAEAGAQVGVYSTALFEGLAHELPTVLVDLPGLDWTRPLLDLAPSVALVATAEELATVLPDLRRPAPAIHRRFFRPNALENARKVITALMT